MRQRQSTTEATSLVTNNNVPSTTTTKSKATIRRTLALKIKLLQCCSVVIFVVLAVLGLVGGRHLWQHYRNSRPPPPPSRVHTSNSNTRRNTERQERRLGEVEYPLHRITNELRTVDDAQYNISVSELATLSKRGMKIDNGLPVYAALIASKATIVESLLRCGATDIEEDVVSAFIDAVRHQAAVVQDLESTAKVKVDVGKQTVTAAMPRLFLLNSQLPYFVSTVLPQLYRVKVGAGGGFVLISGSCFGEGPLGSFITASHDGLDGEEQQRAVGADDGSTRLSPPSPQDELHREQGNVVPKYRGGRAETSRLTTPHARLEQLIHCPYLKQWYAAALDVHHSLEVGSSRLQPWPVGVSSSYMVGDEPELQTARSSLLGFISDASSVGETSAPNQDPNDEVSLSPPLAVYMPFSCTHKEALQAANAPDQHETTTDMLQRLCGHFVLSNAGPPELGKELRESEAKQLPVPIVFASSQELSTPVRKWEAMMKSAVFVMCPPPTANSDTFDTPLIWETLAVGSVPIVRRTQVSAILFANAPVILIDHFEDIATMKMGELMKWAETIGAITELESSSDGTDDPVMSLGALAFTLSRSMEQRRRELLDVKIWMDKLYGL